MGAMGQLIEVNGAELTAYLATPPAQVRGGLIVIHEIWGLVDHIKDVADRFAEQGYLSMAPDLLTGVGISPVVGQELLRLRASDDAEERNRLQPLLREKMAPLQQPAYARWVVGALRDCVDHLARRLGPADRVGVVGFCFGGSYSFALAAADSRIRAAVPFYGSPPDPSEVAKIACPVLAFYGDQDARLMEGLSGVTEAMTAAGVDFTAQVYPGVGHAFFNDANPPTYDASAAADAWGRVLSFLERSLRSEGS
jgi:carboxymethylenebutenolidase